MVHRALRGSTVVGTAGFCLNMVLGLVYAWSLFAGPLQDAFGGTAVDTSRIFSVSMMGLCLGHLASGWLSPRTSPRFVMLLAAGFAAVGFAGSALAASYGWLTVSYGVCCGFATGMGANCVLNSVLPWFSNRKGAASGVLLAGVGLGPLVLGPVVGALIAQAGWRTAFAAMAVVAGGMLAAGSLVLRQPSTGGMLARANAAEGDDLTPSDSSEAVSDVDTPNAAASLGTREMLRTRAFWTLFCWISLVSSGGLALISNAVPAALDVMGTREAWAVMAATGGHGRPLGLQQRGPSRGRRPVGSPRLARCHGRGVPCLRCLYGSVRRRPGARFVSAGCSWVSAAWGSLWGLGIGGVRLRGPVLRAEALCHELRCCHAQCFGRLMHRPHHFGVLKGFNGRLSSCLRHLACGCAAFARVGGVFSGRIVTVNARAG